MKIIYVCSPLRGDYETNIVQAKQYCRAIALGGNIPIAPHVYCTSFLDDAVPDERAVGLKIGLELLRICDEVRVFGAGISDGMRAEIEEAEKRGISVIRNGGKTE